MADRDDHARAQQRADGQALQNAQRGRAIAAAPQKRGERIADRAHVIMEDARRTADAAIARGQRFQAELTDAFTQGLAPPRSTAEPRPGRRYP